MNHKVIISGKLRFTEINKTIDPISIFLIPLLELIKNIRICSFQYEFSIERAQNLNPIC